MKKKFKIYYLKANNCAGITVLLVVLYNNEYHIIQWSGYKKITKRMLAELFNKGCFNTSKYDNISTNLEGDMFNIGGIICSILKVENYEL